MQFVSDFLSGVNPIPGVEFRSTPPLPAAFYRVGSDGSVWSRQKRGCVPGRFGQWRRLKELPIAKGYRAVRVGVNGVHRSYYIHRLVLEAFGGECPEGMQCCHRNGIRTDNRASNLRWGTPASNQADRVLHGTDNRGEKHYRAKLTADDVRRIRWLAGIGLTPTEIARQFPVTDATINGIVRGKDWKHVE